MDDEELPEMTYENVLEQAWAILCNAEVNYSDMGNLSLLVQTHIWLAEEMRVATEKIPQKVKNLLDAYKNEFKGKGEEWPVNTDT